MVRSGGACTLNSHALALPNRAAGRPCPRGRHPVIRSHATYGPGNTLQRTLSSLREREFAWYFAGNAAFFMAMQMQFVLRAQLAYDLSAEGSKATGLGLGTLGAAAPIIFVAPVVGLIADRVNKRTLLIVTQSAAALISLVTTVLILTDLMEYWYLFLLAFSAGTIFSLNMPARQALVPQLVPQHKLMNAVSLQMSGMNLTRIIAPALAGILIAPLGFIGIGEHGGLGWVYLLTFVLFAGAVASEFRLPVHGMQAESEEGESFIDGLRGGFRYAISTPVILMLLVAGMLMPFFAFPVQVMLPLFAEEVFDRPGGMGFGLLMGAGGVGGLIGTIVSANFDGVPNKGHIMFVGAIIMAGFLAAFGAVGVFAFAMVFIAASNIGQMLFMSSNNTAVQTIAPEELRGRVMSIMMMSFGVMPIGVLPITYAADRFGAQETVVVVSLVLLGLLAVVFVAIPAFRNLRIDVLAQAELSPVQAATLVAEGKITRAEADRLTGRLRRTPLPEGTRRKRPQEERIEVPEGATPAPPP
ncbi:MAG: MFS transporter [Dehalococcoidia bacterium]|nr:MFS transporter [Dehalococcoidia bacterium]